MPTNELEAVLSSIEDRAAEFVQAHPLCPDDAGTAVWMAKMAAEFAAKHNEALAADYRAKEAEIERLKAERDVAVRVLSEFAEDVVYQWAYKRGNGYTAGGLSTLERAFDILGWDDPHDSELAAASSVPGEGE